MVSKKFNIPVSAFSSVMGMEISSIAFHFHRLAIISRILEYLGLIVYVFLVLYFVFMLVYHKKILKNKTMVPASFTFAAGSSVLGSRLYMGNLIFFSKILLLIAIIFIIYLGSCYWQRPSEKERLLKFIFMFMPFIGVLSLSNLFTHLHGAF
jgi:C4-dicarboxylate transporter/malic acid transport protein.